MLLNIEDEIGNWYCYPKEGSLFDIKIYIFIESKDTFFISFNVSPESLTWDSYCIPLTLFELKSFIGALKSVNKSYQIKRSGFQSRVITVDSAYKYTIYEKVYLWKIPISFKMMTIDVDSFGELMQDFGE